MIKEWFVLVQGKKEGPFSIEDFQTKIILTIESLVWKKGFTDWKKAGEVEELSVLFKDSLKNEDPEFPPEQKPRKFYKYTENVIDLSRPPGNWIWWIVLFILSFLFAFYNLY